MTPSASTPECIAVAPASLDIFRASSLSADGTSIVTYTSDLRLRTYILPPDLLDCPEVASLESYTASEPVRSHVFALHPSHTLSDPSTTLILVSRADLPLRLTNTLAYQHTHATYPWVNPLTEAYLAPHSLAFGHSGGHFSAGGKEAIALFDLSRSGEGPLSTFQTRKGKGARKAYGEDGVGLAGLVTALSCSGQVLAAGTTGGQVGLYDAREEVGAWAVEGGRGVAQLLWDQGGRYLFVARRSSDDVVVYDVRQGCELGRCVGRKAQSTLGLGVELAQRGGRCEVWAGGLDGCVRIWKDGLAAGNTEADETIKIGDEAVSNVMLHQAGQVWFTTSGVWKDDGRFDDSDDSDDNKTKDGLGRPALHAWRMWR